MVLPSILGGPRQLETGRLPHGELRLLCFVLFSPCVWEESGAAQLAFLLTLGRKGPGLGGPSSEPRELLTDFLWRGNTGSLHTVAVPLHPHSSEAAPL